MSKGIGQNYMYRFKHPSCSFTKKCSLFTKAQIIEYHNREVGNCTVSLTNGVVLTLPKYFKDRIYDDRERRKLTQYLQARHDSQLAKRVENIMRSTGNSEEKVLHDLYVEPTKVILRPVKPSIF